MVARAGFASGSTTMKKVWNGLAPSSSAASSSSLGISSKKRMRMIRYQALIALYMITDQGVLGRPMRFIRK
ncbi:hypothetical protein D3C71_2157840 [compost metagenome]